MNNYKIIMCDDSKAAFGKLSSIVRALKRKYPFLEELSKLTFQEILEDNKLENCDADLLILDLWEEVSDKWPGKDCLELINTFGKQVPTIIFTGEKDSPEKKVNFKKDYPFVIEVLDKKVEKVDGLGLLIEKLLVERLPVQYRLENEHDLLLQYQIQNIGSVKLSEIFKQIKEQYNPKNSLIISRMATGYSGAILLKTTLDNTQYILKIFRDLNTANKEINKANDLYHKFPTKFFNYISPKIFKTLDETTSAILIKLVESSQTLFNTLVNGVTPSKAIEEICDEIFLGNHGLSSHYRTNTDQEASWTSIFEKFKDEKSAFLDVVYEELKPIIDGYEFDLSALTTFVRYQSYKRLDKTKLNRKSKKVLCHGDLHSKNILIQGKKPYLIDTGAIAYDYWCMDLCRLIVDLFLNGLDFGTKHFYDITFLDENVKNVELIAQMKCIKSSPQNSGIVTCINWLVSNCEEIYNGLFSKNEYQLGLVKEFLHFTYRSESVPPNKRAIAILAAYKCLVEAEQTF